VSGGGAWYTDLGGSYEDVYLSYRLKFSENFNPVDGGKLFGLFGGEGDGLCGSTDEDGDGIADLFNVMVMFEVGDPVFYVYHYDKDEDCGDVSGISGGEQIMDGEWHSFLLHVHMNSVNSYDGYSEIWIDGEYADYYGNLRFRVGANVFGIETIGFTTFFGGDAKRRCYNFEVSEGLYGCDTYSDGTNYYFFAPRKTEYLYVDDIVVYN